ncbi:MAG: phosphoesterase, partial [Myxococcaceae bacterium]|nr:phosphoesterase [Myxococcaceae bacterium]
PVLLNRIPRERWMEIATAARDALTDEVIDEAFSTWHPEAYQVDGARIAGYLKLRREQLVEVAAAFFDHVNQTVDVLGSTDDDLFELWFEDAGSVRVAVSARDKPNRPAYFDRVFAPEHTGELRLYALEGDDALVVHGTPHRKIDIRFVGGEGRDAVSAAGTPGSPISARAIQLYDAAAGATIDPSISVRDERSNLAQLNQYDSEGNHEPNYVSFMPGLFLNPDDGVYLGGKLTYLVHGYKQSPFAARHDLAAYFATATLGAAVDYSGVFPHSADGLDQQLALSLKTPTFTRNFFGYTNRYTEDGEALDFYRVRQARYEGRYGLSFGFAGDRSRVGAQLLGQAIVTEPTEGRFVTVSADVPPDDLGPRFFAGARLFAQTNTYDNVAFPRRGVALHASVEGRYDVVRGKQFSTNYRLAAATAIPFDRQQRFVLLTRAMVEGIVGEHPFYFAPTLGAGELRAYPRERFAGEVAFAHSTDLRVDVFRIYSVVPGTVGVNLSIDHGRVFGASISGGDYHLSYGGGVWWFLLDSFGVSLSYHRSLEGAFRVSLAVGPLFSDTGF